MKIVFSLLLLLFLSVASFAQQTNEQKTNDVVAGKGWGIVSLNAKKKDVEAVLGKGKDRSQYDDVYFIDYPEKGVQISYANKKDTVVTIYFYNKQKRYENFAVPSLKTDKGIDWNSSPDEVIKAYGKPKNNFKGDAGDDWQRIEYDGIDFRFENGKMVRIGISGND